MKKLNIIIAALVMSGAVFAQDAAKDSIAAAKAAAKERIAVEKAAAKAAKEKEKWIAENVHHIPSAELNAEKDAA